MQELTKLFSRIIQRVNINLRELEFDVEPYVSTLITPEQMSKFCAFYGVTPDHPLNLQFKHSGLAGSYFLGRCRVTNSLLYKSDIRGDELKKQGDTLRSQDTEIQLTGDEEVDIENSTLIKTLVHNFSHDPETPEKFYIKDTVSTHYANIHGSPTEGCFLGPFATVDLTTARDCMIGSFSYVQAGEISHQKIDSGTIWVKSGDQFDFQYRFPAEELEQYIFFSNENQPQGLLIDFIEDRKEAFQRVFDLVNTKPAIEVPGSTSLNQYAVTKPTTTIGENVLVSQRAYLQNSSLGKGSNAQENCFIINSNLQGNNVTAHGAKIIDADLGRNVFVGFNSFLRGRPNCRITIGKKSIVMPHTIIDAREPMMIPEQHIVWGLITSQKDLEDNSISIDALTKVDSRVAKGNMVFEGCGADLVSSFQERIHHILEANGAFHDGKENTGHAQRNQNMSLNTIQPYPQGELQGMYPTISILP